ncbi:preprotein translocase subunit YajC [Campylobacter canadensis]|uniref:Sec translocon accessory complex subunit YajC n=1 Tax=Campylobacter canadensis TaxID=449520 RepID=A0ABS7WP18_9BACT|nr:preprotein translocase subunit YajC [Campylobacter canadensis]MBZ7986520.1 preprotein translocase subunit YajC [Campylobacter canadensis]MBZ7994075.1 preprotein translocase subunit YajC [Campylobacter canadensis]MBZ7995922.1 preprotein translocase subunit YajC [Campylobacter canadensis]MBZ7997556.1 preprotein translocase subunit YajC [Campylobacter canadensis]MBZ7999406.1 preprotein translocase subunit YajC [Campylobacter canadensis]
MQNGNFFYQILPIIVFIAIFYFLLIRPQQKQQKAHQQMLNSLAKGDKIVTQGGIIAEVVKVEDDHLKIRLNDDVVVKLDRNFVLRKIDETAKEVVKK